MKFKKLEQEHVFMFLCAQRWRKLPADFANSIQFYPEQIEQKSRRVPSVRSTVGFIKG